MNGSISAGPVGASAGATWTDGDGLAGSACDTSDPSSGPDVLTSLITHPV